MITVISGTNRAGSNTLKVARQALGCYREGGGGASLLDLAELPAAIFSPSAYAEKPAAFAPVSRAVLDSDGLVLVVPEYNGSMPGVLKLFIDMLEFPESFDRRPVCFIGLSAGESGAVRPVEHLQQVFGYRNAFLYPERVFLPKVSKLLGADGLIHDPELVERLRRQARGFTDFVRRLRSP